MFSLLSAVVILISLIIRPDGLPTFEICSFKAFTGLPCPGCGLTRGFCAISHAQFSDAWEFNPFSFVLYIAGVFVIASPILVSRFHSLTSEWSVKVLKAVSIAIVIAMVIFGIFRITKFL